jgi:carboxypeptidase Taq
MAAIDELKTILVELTYLGEAASVLGWDQNTYMPTGGAESRAKQLSTLSQLIHSKFTSDETGSLLSKAENQAANFPEGSIERDLLRKVRKDYDQSRKFPSDFVAERSQSSSIAQIKWIEARKNNDFKAFSPDLKKNIELSQRTAEYLGYSKLPYDALLDLHETGLTTERTKQLFDSARPTLVSLVRKTQEKSSAIDASVLSRFYPEAQQEKLSKKVSAMIGFDFNRGRLDKTTHPFATSFGRNDVRITTRYDEHSLPYCLMSVIHESGHAMYEQNVSPDFDETPLSGGCSMGVHESQSRLWENIVGRSRGFWSAIFPSVLEAFPGTITPEEEKLFYRAINKIQPSFIRTEADEVTYNLHIFLRFELEQALISGELKVDDAPAAWNEKMQSTLGIVPPTDTLGILQDVHWAMGSLGYFPTYSIGNFLSAQVYEAALKSNPEIPSEISNGNFKPLFSWLKENIWRHGSRYFPSELILKATGKPLDTTAFTRYLTEKFTALYDL